MELNVKVWYEQVRRPPLAAEAFLHPSATPFRATRFHSLAVGGRLHARGHTLLYVICGGGYSSNGGAHRLAEARRSHLSRVLLLASGGAAPPDNGGGRSVHPLPSADPLGRVSFIGSPPRSPPAFRCGQTPQT